MQRILITGFSGFVSSHFLVYLNQMGEKIEVLGIDINEPEFRPIELNNLIIRFKKLDLLESDKLENILYAFQPNYILHLASYSSVGFSWKNPALSFRNNMEIFLNLMEILRKVSPSCRVLSVGSSEGYGNVDEKSIPLKENSVLNPVSPYAVSRVSQEFLSKVYCDGYGIDIVITRSFNHIGPGQREVFVISSFAKQLVEIKKGIRKEPVLITGDTGIIRDFLDVRDVVDAYHKLLICGEKGEVYNICSNQGTSISEIIDIMCGLLCIDVRIEIDKNLIRPRDNRIIIGSNTKLKEKTGWMQKISLEQSLSDILTDWYNRI